MDLSLVSIIMFAGTGIIAGFLSGLLGIGGGIVVVPALAEIYQALHFSEHANMHLAIGSSLAIMVITTATATLTHHRKGSVDWWLFRRLSPMMFLFAFVGTQIADLLPGTVLKGLFALFLFIVTVLLIQTNGATVQKTRPSTAIMLGAGCGIGVLSGMLGVGGGLILVPFLARQGVAFKDAAGTTASCALPNAVVATMGMMLAGGNEPGLPTWSVGYVHLPSVGIVAAVSMLFVPIGVSFAHRWPVKTIKLVFSAVLVLVALRFGYTSVIS